MILYSIVPPEGLLRRESSCHAPVKQPIYDKHFLNPKLMPGNIITGTF